MCVELFNVKSRRGKKRTMKSTQQDPGETCIYSSKSKILEKSHALVCKSQTSTKNSYRIQGKTKIVLK